MSKPSRAKIINKLIGSWRDLEVLDCGSSNGYGALCHYMKYDLKTNQITAVDVNEEALEPLRERGVHTICLDLENENLTGKINKQFDVIICCEVFEHLTEKTEEKVIFDFLKLLKKNGSLIISFPEKTKMNRAAKSIKDFRPHIRQPKINVIEELLYNRFDLYLNILANRQVRLMVFQNKK